jgi:ABC-type glycerol-3-phosphate transport system permease component
LTVLIKQLTDETAPASWGDIATIGLFQMIPVMLIFIFAQEYLLNIYAGGSKGSS